MEITEMDEDVAVSYRYDPYGAVTITRNSQEQSSDPLGNPWMYTARFTDEETGLYFYRARYYSPDTGRFLQRDPIGYVDGLNLYVYAKGAPGNHVDPLGLKSQRPQDKAREACNAAKAKAKDDMAECAANSDTALQCQECCGFAAWDALAALGAAGSDVADDCAKTYPDEKEEAEEKWGANADNIKETLGLTKAAATAAEVAGAAAEGANTLKGGGHVGVGINASAAAYSVAASYVAIQGAKMLADILAGRNAYMAALGGNDYVNCLRSGAGYVNRATYQVELAYNKCMNSCRKKWGRNCGITPNKKGWRWLLENDDYRVQ
jgi:RHS repeat-associated protein